jgi:hypothetical protein
MFPMTMTVRMTTVRMMMVVIVVMMVMMYLMHQFLQERVIVVVVMMMSVTLTCRFYIEMCCGDPAFGYRFTRKIIFIGNTEFFQFCFYFGK